jgi:hypothetical protein
VVGAFFRGRLPPNVMKKGTSDEEFELIAG